MAGIAVYGAGAVGCVIGGGLARAGRDVVLIDPWREHVEAINSTGLHLALEGEGVFPVPVRALHPEELASGQTFDIAHSGGQVAGHRERLGLDVVSPWPGTAM